METINPNNIIDIDPETISFITLKNGNMVMIDELTKEKPHKRKIDFDNTDINKNTQKEPPKNTELALSETQYFSYKGIPKDITPIIRKSNFNIISKIIKNIDFFYKPQKTKENPQKINNEKMPSLNSSIEFKSLMFQPKPENNENITVTTKNNENELFMDTNLSKQIVNYKPNDEEQKTIIKNENNNNKNETIEHVNENINNTAINKQLIEKSLNFNNMTEVEITNISKDVNKSNYIKKYNKLNRGRTPGLKQSKNYAKAVVSINIPAEEDENIDLIKQFNLLVDRLNDQKIKNKNITRQKEIKTKNNPYYELYKKNCENYFDNVTNTYNRIQKKNNHNLNLTQNNLFANNDISMNGFGKNNNSLNSRILLLKEKSFSNISYRNDSSGREGAKGNYDSEIVFPSNFHK